MRQIDADELKYQAELCRETTEAFIELIDQQPEITNDPIKGLWVEEKQSTFLYRTFCSVCGESAPYVFVSDDYYGSTSHGETRKTKYCPNCGAKMENADNNGTITTNRIVADDDEADKEFANRVFWEKYGLIKEQRR